MEFHPRIYLITALGQLSFLIGVPLVLFLIYIRFWPIKKGAFGVSLWLTFISLIRFIFLTIPGSELKTLVLLGLGVATVETLIRIILTNHSKIRDDLQRNQSYLIYVSTKLGSLGLVHFLNFISVLNGPNEFATLNLQVQLSPFDLYFSPILQSIYSFNASAILVYLFFLSQTNSDNPAVAVIKQPIFTIFYAGFIVILPVLLSQPNPLYVHLFYGFQLTLFIAILSYVKTFYHRFMKDRDDERKRLAQPS